MLKKFWITSFLLATLVIAGCSSDKKTDESGAFVSADGEFSVAFPAEPVESVEKLETEVGTVDTYMFIHEEGDSAVYIASYVDYPEELVAEGDEENMLEGAKNGQLSSLGASPVVEKAEDITVDGYPGLFIKAYGDGLYSISKIVLADERLYQIMVMSTEDYVAQESEDEFLGSFKITK